MARGNGALSVTLTAMGTLLSAATLPPVAALGLALIRAEGGAEITIPVARTAADLVLTIILPVGLGMATRPAVTRRPRLERRLHAVATLATLAITALLLATQWKTATADLGRLTLAVVVFSTMAFVIGDRLARALGAGAGDRVAVALELPGRNLGVAAVVGVQSLGRPEIAGLTAAVFVVQVPLLLAASGAIGRARHRAAGQEEGRFRSA